MKTPWWRGRGAPKKMQQIEGDARFWYASGAYTSFLDWLWGHALAPIRNTGSVEHGMR